MRIAGVERPLWVLVAGLIATGFGILTVLSGANVLFGPDEARRAAGAYLPSLVWFNFVAGFAYVAVGAGIWFRRPWSAPLAAGIAIATLAAFAAFGVHVSDGGAYEMRTVGAMTLRAALWVTIAFLACRSMGCTACRRAR